MCQALALYYLVLITVHSTPLPPWVPPTPYPYHTPCTTCIVCMYVLLLLCYVCYCCCVVVSLLLCCCCVAVLHERRKLTLHVGDVLLSGGDGALCHCAIVCDADEARNCVTDRVEYDCCVRCAVEQCADSLHGVSSLCVSVFLTVYSIAHTGHSVNPFVQLFLRTFVLLLFIDRCNLFGKNRCSLFACTCLAKIADTYCLAQSGPPHAPAALRTVLFCNGSQIKLRGSL